MRRILVVSIGFVLGMQFLSAQQQAMFTHYAFNTLAVNPGYAGSREALTVTGLHRSQWVGFDGAPITQTLTLHSPIANEKLGLGLSFLNDKIGPMNNTSLYADLAYSIPVSTRSKLALGLKTGVDLMQADLAEVNTIQGNDNSFAESIRNQWLPNFGLGAYYHNPTWYLGLSVPRILQNDISTVTGSQGTSSAKEVRHFFLIAGTVFSLSPNVKLKPTTYFKVTEAAPVEADLTAMFIFKDKLELGVMGRTGDAVGALLGYNISPALRVGYSFDWSFVNNTAKYNFGSHELMFRYDFVFNENKKIRSPRYF
jgi:type IX secretion system PorP/SprF family membrane protein